MELITLQRETGRQKHDIVKTGRAEAADLFKVSLPPFDKKWFFHPVVALAILSLMKEKIWILVLGISKSKPRNLFGALKL